MRSSGQTTCHSRARDSNIGSRGCMLKYGLILVVNLTSNYLNYELYLGRNILIMAITSAYR